MNITEKMDNLLNELKIQETSIKGTAKFMMQYPLESVNNIQ